MTSVLQAYTPEPNHQSRGLHSGTYTTLPSDVMSNYGQQYNPESQEGQGEHTHRPRQQSLPNYPASSTLPSTPYQRPLPVPTQSYSMSYYGSTQPSMTYPLQAPYAPVTQSYQGYPQTVPTSSPNYTYYQQPVAQYASVPSQPVAFPDYDSSASQMTPQQSSPQFLQPGEPSRSDPRISRSTSLASNASSMQYTATEEYSRSTSPSATEMAHYGYRNDQGTWSCAFPGCTSKSTFQRGCDLRKHYRRHTKTLFCRHAGCPQATEGGFSSKKDRARHEAKHNPQITCEWAGCDRLFSRMDNMKDHVRRIHKRDAAKAS